MAGPADTLTQANALRQVLEPASCLPHLGAPTHHVRMDVDPPGVTARGGARRSSRGQPAEGPVAHPSVVPGPTMAQRVARVDMRDTTMLMGLEESEEEMATNLVLEEVHRWNTNDLV